MTIGEWAILSGDSQSQSLSSQSGPVKSTIFCFGLLTPTVPFNKGHRTGSPTDCSTLFPGKTPGNEVANYLGVRLGCGRGGGGVVIPSHFMLSILKWTNIPGAAGRTTDAPIQS